ncbi:GMC oxidoreductase [Rhizobium sp. Root708]|uniref:GMC oxidoreductase n=1 Tax=Rhizobium sp. Root708 TaxID=1736592 RepID=UPI0009EA860E|nr:GMC oxidoreductase [Rhizobium sp. Root708]
MISPGRRDAHVEQSPNGVVDGNCKVHDLKNLFIARGLILPTSGQANPTLPAVAFALRLADHLTAPCC